MANRRHSARSTKANLKANLSQAVTPPLQNPVVPSTPAAVATQCPKHTGTSVGGHAAQLEKVGDVVGKKKVPKPNVVLPDDEPVNAMAPTPW